MDERIFEYLLRTDSAILLYLQAEGSNLQAAREAREKKRVKYIIKR